MLPLSARRIARQYAGAEANLYVEVLPGGDAPHVAGRSYYWVTPGGRPVHYPAAYRRAYGRPVYRPSSRRVEVGVDWLTTRCAEYAAALAVGAGI